MRDKKVSLQSIGQESWYFTAQKQAEEEKLYQGENERWKHFPATYVNVQKRSWRRSMKIRKEELKEEQEK